MLVPHRTLTRSASEERGYVNGSLPRWRFGLVWFHKKLARATSKRVSEALEIERIRKVYDALAHRRIAGAALDCFENEPVVTPHRFGELDNVLLAPHCIAWTDELFRDIGRTACQSLLDLSRGRRPHGAVNPEVLDFPAFLEKWHRTRR